MPNLVSDPSERHMFDESIDESPSDMMLWLRGHVENSETPVGDSSGQQGIEPFKKYTIFKNPKLYSSKSIIQQSGRCLSGRRQVQQIAA